MRYVKINYGDIIHVESHGETVSKFCKKHNTNYVYLPEQYRVDFTFTEKLKENYIHLNREPRSGGNYCEVSLGFDYDLIVKYVHPQIPLPKLQNNELISVF